MEMDTEIEALGGVSFRPQPTGDWELEASLLPGGHDNAGSYVFVRFTDTVSASGRDATYVRILVRGQHIWHMPHRYKHEGSENVVRWAANANISAFGRKAILAQIVGNDPFKDIPQDEWLLSFAYKGARLNDDQMCSIRLLVDLLAGNRGQPVLEEGFDEHGNLL